MPVPRSSGYILQDDPETPATDATVSFREIIPKPDHPKIAGIGDHSALSWCESRKAVEAPAWLINRLAAENLEKPHIGFSADGKVDPTVHQYGADEGAPVKQACESVKALIAQLSEEEKTRTCLADIESDDFRLWSNPELYVNPGGLRLDEVSKAKQEAVHKVLKASLSESGYKKTHGCMLTNGFLGQLIHGEKVLNEHSYNFRLFGEPSEKTPWGWTLFGHHLCLAVAFVGPRMVIGPTFMGAEPDRIDIGEHAGLRLFSSEEIEGLNLMRSLTPEQQKQAQYSESMAEGLPEDRWNPFDERHLGGARQDNRTVPYEGCLVSEMTKDQQAQVMRIFAAFNDYLPQGPFDARMKQIEAHLSKTYFSWIGKFGLGDPYYYRLHSPVAFSEFDFHCGIFLSNTSPAKCHIHTVNRLPNKADYGAALRLQYQKEHAKAEGKDLPVNLCSVNTAPERAKRLIGILIKDVADRYSIKHAANSETIEGVKPMLLSIQPPPGVLFCASMWTPEQQEEIQRIARETIPGIKTAAIPPGLQVERGPDAVVDFLREKIDGIMQGK